MYDISKFTEAQMIDFHRRLDQAAAAVTAVKNVWVQVEGTKKQLADLRGKKWAYMDAATLLAGALVSWLVYDSRTEFNLGTFMMLWACGSYFVRQFAQLMLERHLMALGREQDTYLYHWLAAAGDSTGFWVLRDCTIDDSRSWDEQDKRREECFGELRRSIFRQVDQSSSEPDFLKGLGS